MGKRLEVSELAQSGGVGKYLSQVSHAALPAPGPTHLAHGAVGVQGCHQVEGRSSESPSMGCRWEPTFPLPTILPESVSLFFTKHLPWASGFLCDKADPPRTDCLDPGKDARPVVGGCPESPGPWPQNAVPPPSPREGEALAGLAGPSISYRFQQGPQTDIRHNSSYSLSRETQTQKKPNMSIL